MSVQQQGAMNLMVPAEGGVDIMSIAIPGDLGGSPQGYTVDFRSLSQTVGGTPFIPQACSIDLTNLPAGQSVIFKIPALGYQRVLIAGTNATFQFPAIQNLVVLFSPSSGTPSFPTFWYNYPAFPDGGGGIATFVTDSGVLAELVVINQSLQQPPGSTGTDYSANKPALLANLILTIPVNSLRKGFFIQNQDTGLIQVVIDDGAGANVSIVYLAGASATPGAGGSIDMTGTPTQGRIRVFSAIAAPAVSAHDF